MGYDFVHECNNMMYEHGSYTIFSLKLW